MFVVGVTGGSGSGKSTICKALTSYGYIVLDADKIAREIVIPGEPALAEIIDAFGSAICQRDGSLNRKSLANIVFNDENSLQKLNAITHKYITQKIQERINAQENAVFIIDAPLLYESGLDALCNVTIGVTANLEIRIERIINRDNLSDKEARMRLDAQDSIEQNLKRVDFLMDTSENAAPSVYAEMADVFIKGVLNESN